MHLIVPDARIQRRPCRRARVAPVPPPPPPRARPVPASARRKVEFPQASCRPPGAGVHRLRIQGQQRRRGSDRANRSSAAASSRPESPGTALPRTRLRTTHTGAATSASRSSVSPADQPLQADRVSAPDRHHQIGGSRAWPGSSRLRRGARVSYESSSSVSRQNPRVDDTENRPTDARPPKDVLPRPKPAARAIGPRARDSGQHPAAREEICQHNAARSELSSRLCPAWRQAAARPGDSSSRAPAPERALRRTRRRR